MVQSRNEVGLYHDHALAFQNQVFLETAGRAISVAQYQRLPSITAGTFLE
jgi:hypothetical protein